MTSTEKLTNIDDGATFNKKSALKIDNFVLVQKRTFSFTKK